MMTNWVSICDAVRTRPLRQVTSEVTDYITESVSAIRRQCLVLFMWKCYVTEPVQDRVLLRV